MLENATLLITGGTGSLGSAVLKRFLRTTVREVRIFSRDEKKQDDMRRALNHPKLKFYIGNVRDYRSVENAMEGVDFVLHAAALKQVPSCEFHPMEVVKTNILGTENVFEAAIRCGVRNVVCLSTDKAVYPINAMGMSKGLMEKIMVAKARFLDSGRSTLCGTRYGNVLASRGSVVPLFAEQVSSGRPITVTDPEMTRFMMTMEQAVNLALFALSEGSNGDIFVHKAPAATLETLAQAIREIYDRPDHPVEIIGRRHGEKLYETLLSREERATAENLGSFYRIRADATEPERGAFADGWGLVDGEGADYTSHNTERLSVAQTKELLLGLDFIQAAVAQRPVLTTLA